jgi:hypothetical protein
MAIGALLFCLVAHYSSTTVDWTSTKNFTDAFANVTQSVALIGGGVWAYFKFAKGRTFQDRLIPDTFGEQRLLWISRLSRIMKRMTYSQIGEERNEVE